MYIVYIICFCLLLVGMILAFNLTPSNLSEDIEDLANNKTTDIKVLAEKTQSKKKKGKFSSFLSETYEIMTYMKATGRFFTVCMFSVGMLVIGVLLVSFFNVYYIPGVILLCIAFPFLFVYHVFYRYSRLVMKELEITLNQITISYLRSEKILESVEENIPMINPPIKKYFQEFVYQLKYVNPNEREAIEDLSEKIDDNIFKEWCDAFKKCANNRTLKYLLNPSLSKYTTVKNLDDKVKFRLFNIKVSYWVTLGLVYSNYLLLYFVGKDWFNILVSTPMGKLAGGVVFFVSVVTTIIMFFMTKPIKYKI